MQFPNKTIPGDGYCGYYVLMVLLKLENSLAMGDGTMSTHNVTIDTLTLTDEICYLRDGSPDLYPDSSSSSSSTNPFHKGSDKYFTDILLACLRNLDIGYSSEITKVWYDRFLYCILIVI
jgi:hypothetical protein